MHRATILLATAVAATAIAGCGGSDDDSKPAATTGPQRERPLQTKYRAGTPQAEVATVAARYLRAISTGDYKTACRTRAASEQRALAKRGGSCAQVLAGALDPNSVDSFGNLDVTSVVISGRQATVDLKSAGTSQNPLKLKAALQRGHWVLVGGAG